MYGRNRRVIPREELRDFANTLFHHLYSSFNMVEGPHTDSEHFRRSMAIAVLCVERVTRDFNNRIIQDYMPSENPLKICVAVCQSYPSDDYFKRLIYMNDLGCGPSLWMLIFRSDDILPEFELYGGWQGFADAAEALTEFYNTHHEEPDFRDRYLPATYIQEVSLRMESINLNRLEAEELRSMFRELAIHNPLVLAQPAGRFEQDQPAGRFEQDQPAGRFEQDQPAGRFEQDQPGKPKQESQPSAVALETKSSEGTSKEMEFDSPPALEIAQQIPVKEGQRKRRHESGDKELSPIPVQPTKKQVQIATPSKDTPETSGESSKKTPRKRKLDSPTEDSDEEQDFPSSFKPKVEKK